MHFLWATVGCAQVAQRQPQQYCSHAVAAVDNDADASTAKVKWKKLAKRVLTAAGGKLKVKKLQKQLLQQAGVPQPQQHVALRQLMVQLTSSKQFTVDGSSMMLTAQ